MWRRKLVMFGFKAHSSRLHNLLVTECLLSLFFPKKDTALQMICRRITCEDFKVFAFHKSRNVLS